MQILAGRGALLNCPEVQVVNWIKALLVFEDAAMKLYRIYCMLTFIDWQPRSWTDGPGIGAFQHTDTKEEKERKGLQKEKNGCCICLQGQLVTRSRGFCCIQYHASWLYGLIKGDANLTTAETTFLCVNIKGNFFHDTTRLAFEEAACAHASTSECPNSYFEWLQWGVTFSQ
eukprot:480085-Pelagomonas_calceolata.AAC.2